jgi:2-hydroxychromene-2-carboxylate isomerase
VGAPPIQFFYGIGSRYSYLASTQLGGLESATGRTVRWRPLYSGDLFAARGRNPFDGSPLSEQYDWSYRRLDAERWAAYYGVPYREPEGVRFDPRRLAIVCTAADRQGAIAPFSRRLFQAIFIDGDRMIDDAACKRFAVDAGLSSVVFARALEEPATAAALAATLEEALAAGIFGVPSFVVDGRVFFGNDRLPLVRHYALKET